VPKHQTTEQTSTKNAR